MSNPLCSGVLRRAFLRSLFKISSSTIKIGFTKIRSNTKQRDRSTLLRFLKCQVKWKRDGVEGGVGWGGGVEWDGVGGWSGMGWRVEWGGEEKA